MREESDVPVLDLRWLEEHLGNAWAPAEERAGEDVWRDAHRFTESYPVQALWLIARDYLMNAPVDLERRLRILLPVLSRFGDANLTVTGLLLMALVALETEGSEDVARTIAQQVAREVEPMGDVPQSLPQVLFAFLQGQRAHRADRGEDGDGWYERVLRVPFGGEELLNVLLGRMYRVIGERVNGGADHPLQARWRQAASRWCSRYPQSPVVAHLDEQRPARPSAGGADRGEPALRFTFFHTFQGYTRDGVPVIPEGYARHKVRALLGYLLLQPHCRAPKEQVICRLFGEEAEGGEANYLHVSVHRLRALLQRQTGVAGNWVHVRGGMVGLNDERIDEIDLMVYRKRASVGHELWRTDREGACELYAQAVDLWAPVIAPEFAYDDWMVETRAWLEQEQRRMLGRLWQEYRRGGRLEEAIHHGERLYAMDPLDLTVLEDLCEDWRRAGQIRRLQSACERAVAALVEDGEGVPEWLAQGARMRVHTARDGGARRNGR
ncbi:BTAD domain-containing putative transcriptional regulator [Alicyclobacillus sp.]|uniref:AfsR/SARP family transcriptional regulator n=1 Tax=Alicyclobacillus sp. TaxID=61169 RepID=UPI0025B87908|nr:BTAD domain-containing putative transcriptional regulator [Alicyclobacillus sp.]MCL6517855.1 hypothetical protein [Alicyclobacillus sp.]